MSLRIATFNLKDFFMPRRGDETLVVDAKIANIAANLRRANADVVALQEVGEPELLQRLVSKDVADLGYGAPVLGTEDKRGIRVAILSRLPVQWSQIHTAKALPFPRFYETDAEPFPNRIPLRRGIVHVRVEAEGIGEVDVMTAHFKSNLGAPMKRADGTEILDASSRGLGEAALRSMVQRAAEALFVRGLVDDVLAKSPDHAVCVLGDLNDSVDSLPVRLLRGVGEPASAKGILRPCAELLDESLRYSCFHGNARTMIDHVLVTERLRAFAKSYAIYNEELRYHGPHVDGAPITPDSDHALCLATFSA